MLRIISLAPSNTEILASLGALEDVIAISKYCDFPSETETKQKLSGWSTTRPDEVTVLSPDLVLLSGICQAELEKKLSDEKIHTLKLDPRTLDEVAESFLILGETTGKQTEAKKLSKQFQDSLTKIKQKIPPHAKRPRIYVEEWSKPPMVSGHWVPELIEIAGGIPFPLSNGERSRNIHLEEIIQFNPEMIFLSICAASTKANPNLIFKRKGWEILSAVQNRFVFSINDSLLNRPGHRLIQGAEILQSVIGECFWGSAKSVCAEVQRS